MTPPLFPPIPRPASAEGATEAVLPAILSEIDAEAVIVDAVRGRKLSPADSDKARIDEPRLLSVPFWRIEVSVDGFHLNLSGASVSVGGARVPIPTGGARHKDAAIVLCARSSFPYEARVPAFLQGVVTDAPLDIPAHELVGQERGRPEGEVVDPDIARADAERAATRLVVRSVAPTNALYLKYEPKVLASALVTYPVYWAAYLYEGEARRHAGERFFVVVSARNGKVIAAHHPSGLRAAAARFRRLLGG